MHKFCACYHNSAGEKALYNFGLIIVLLSRITNKWMKLGVPLVGCGDYSTAAHGKL